jgi:pimeloyl-ACP methyl ester carboxylesterase
MKPVKAYVDGRYGQIHYCICGAGAPLVLMHQSPTSMIQFTKVWSVLAAKGFRVIAIDLPGFGGSDGPDTVPTITDYAHIVPTVLDELGIDTADILGHHTGAIVATEVALQFPSRIKRIILNGPLPLTPDERAFFKQHLAAEKEWSPRADGSHLTEQWLFRISAQPGWTDLEAIHRHVVAGAAAWPRAWYPHDAVMAYDHGAAMLKVQHPCLVFSNTGDAIHAIAERAKTLRPDFAWAQIEGGTFDIVDEQPDAWAEVVSGWLLQGNSKH